MKTNAKIIVGVATVVVSIVAVVIFLTFRENPSPIPELHVTDTMTLGEGEPTIPETKQIAEGWRGYENAAFRFRLLYPEELSVREYTESGNAMSATFEDPQTGEGFQIYVTPYGETQITKEHFQLDIPSGVMKEPTDVIIGGVQGTMFFSKNSIMGDTREVWFINNGFLYEVVTYKQLDAWLGTVMQTWKFL